MHTQLLDLLQSPDDGSPLSLSAQTADGDDILSGTLTDGAGRTYLIEFGIPRLLPGALLAGQKTEIAARDAQVAAYDRMAFLHLFGKVEIPLTLRALRPRPTDLLLEAGCGTGRMTTTLSPHVREIVAMDFSFASLRANQEKLKRAGIANVHLVQADLCRLPFRSEAFDSIVSCQVLEHVPGPQARLDAVRSLARVARPGALVALSAYKHSLLTKAFAQKEGEHAGGIPYFRFTRQEMRETLSAALDVESVTGALVYLYLARCVNRPVA